MRAALVIPAASTLALAAALQRDLAAGALGLEPPRHLREVTWGIAGLLALSGLGNLLSPSRVERLGLGLLALLASLCTLAVATSGTL